MLLKRELPLGRATGTGMGVVSVCVWEGGWIRWAVYLVSTRAFVRE